MTQTLLRRTLLEMREASQLRPPIMSALAQALDRLVPEPMTVEPYGEGVRIRVRGQGAFRLVEVWDADVSLEEFAVAVLGAAQDEVIEAVTHNGWPPADTENP